MYSQLFFIKSHPDNIIISKQMFVVNAFSEYLFFFSKSIFCSPSSVALYANNKTPEPIGHFILTINPTDLFFRQEFLFPIQLSSLPVTYSYLISCSMTIPDWNWIISFSAETTLMLAISLLTRSLSNSGIWQVCFSRKLSISFNRCS